MCFLSLIYFFFFKQMTAYERRISDWSSDVCASVLVGLRGHPAGPDEPETFLAGHWLFPGAPVDDTASPAQCHALRNAVHQASHRFFRTRPAARPWPAAGRRMAGAVRELPRSGTVDGWRSRVALWEIGRAHV